MPINFQPAAPVAPGISAAAGAAQEFNQVLPSLVNQQHNILSAGNELLGTQQHGIDQLIQGLAAQNHFAQQQALANQHVQNQAALSQFEMTQGEQLHLTRLQNAASAVMANDSLSDEDKQNAMTQIYSGINPLQQKQQRMQQQMQQAQFQQMQQQQQMVSRIRNMDAGDLAQMVRDHTVQAPDGSYSVFVNPIDGKPTYHDNQTAQIRAEAMQETARMRMEAMQAEQEMRHREREHQMEMQQMRADLQAREAEHAMTMREQALSQRTQHQEFQEQSRGVMSEQQWISAVRQAQNDANAVAPTPQGQVDNADALSGIYTPDESRQFTRGELRSARLRDLRAERGLGGSYAEYRQSRLGQQPPAGGMYGPGGGPPSGVQGNVGPGGYQPAPQDVNPQTGAVTPIQGPPAPGSQQPALPPPNPGTAPTQTTQGFYAQFDRIRDRLFRRPGMHATSPSVIALNEAEQLLATAGGDPARLSAPQLQEYQRLQNLIREEATR